MSSPYLGTRRLVLRPADLALLRRGARPEGGELPRVFTLGAAEEPVELLLRFDIPLDQGVRLVRASVILDPSDTVTTDGLPVMIHADRVIGRWSPSAVSWSTAPAIQDLRLPRTLVVPAERSPIRLDVTDLVRRWLAHDPADHGLLIVAENGTRTGVTFALGSAPPDLERAASDETPSPAPPRLEIYFR